MSNEKQTTKDLKSDILARIENERLEPCSRFRILCTRSLFVAGALTSVFVGAIAVAVTIFAATNAGWEYYDMTHQNALTFMVAVIPYVWIVLSALTVMVGYYNLRQTKRGYRYPLWFIVASIVGASILGGVAINQLKVASGIDERLGAYFPDHYKSAAKMQKDMWHAPRHGRLFGEFAENEEGALVFVDHKDAVWNIDPVALREYDRTHLHPGEAVRLIGLLDHDTMTVVGCLVLPGTPDYRQQYPDLRELKERRGKFLKRMEDYEMTAMPETAKEDERLHDIFSRCHDVVKKRQGMVEAKPAS